MLDGTSHLRQRQLLTPPFHGDRMRSYGELICNLANQVIGRNQIGKPFYVRAATQQITLKVILDAVFGMKEGDRYEQFQKLLTETVDTLSSPLSASMIFLPSLQKDLGPWSPWGRFLRRQQQVDQLLYAEISDRRKNLDSNCTDILTLLMSAVDAVGQSMSDEELHDELITLLFAGHETTASALAWALYWVHYIPEVKEKLLAELETLGDNPEPTAIAKLPYLSAVCSETLRIYPVAMITFPRMTKSPITIMDRDYDAETIFMSCIYLVHHREDIYPQPHLFQPERFLERQFSNYEYIPFGGGNRRCIGMALAQFEMKLALATIMLNYDLELPHQRPLNPVRRGVTLAPPASLQIICKSQRQKVAKSLIGLTV